MSQQPDSQHTANQPRVRHENESLHFDASPHVTQRVVPTDHSRAEIIFGLFWLSLGAAVSALLEVVYLGTWIAGVPVPYTIVIAFFFNMVLVRTAKLWTPNPLIALTPLYVWICSYFALTITGAVTGDQFLASSLRSMLLLIIGAAGGAYGLRWPRQKA